MAGERRGQVVAQAHPLLVVVLQREHALVGPVAVGQELAERIGIFEHRRFDRIEAVEFVDRTDLRHHRLGRADVVGRAVDEAARQARLEFLRFVFPVAHGARFRMVLREKSRTS